MQKPLVERIQEAHYWGKITEITRLSAEKKKIIGELLLEYGATAELPLESEFCYYLGLPSVLLPKVVTPETWLKWKDIQFTKLFGKALSLPQKKNVAMLQDYIKRFNLPYLAWMEELGTMFVQRYKLKGKQNLDDKMVLIVKKDGGKEKKPKIDENGNGNGEISGPQQCLMRFKKEGDNWVVEK